jgi:hypothetical protein
MRTPSPRSTRPSNTTFTSISTSRPTATSPRRSTRAGSATRAPGLAQRAHLARWKRAPARPAATDRSRLRFPADRRPPRFPLRIFVRGGREHIGQVVLALRVVVAQVLQPARSAVESAAITPVLTRRIAALLLVRVLLLDDRCRRGLQHRAGCGRNRSDRQLRGEHRQPSRRIHQPPQRMRGDQRHVAVQHQHARIVGHAGHRLLHGVPGAELLRLLAQCRSGWSANAARTASPPCP